MAREALQIRKVGGGGTFPNRYEISASAGDCSARFALCKHHKLHTI